MEKWKNGKKKGVELMSPLNVHLLQLLLVFPHLYLHFKRGIAIKVEGIKIELTCKCKHNKFAKQTPSRVINIAKQRDVKLH